MKTSVSNSIVGRSKGHGGSARVFLLVVVVFLLGIAVTALWYQHQRAPGSTNPASTPPSDQAGLTESTRAILRKLNGPVEVHFYALLDPNTVPDSTRAFAGRVSQLLARYEQEANGRIKLTKYEEQSNANANSALADGLKPFNQDKGDACYFGIAVIRGDKKETLPQLSPEWEAALESDLSRAIVRLNESAPVLGAAPAPPPVDPAAQEEVKKILPNYASISFEEGTRVLRQGQQDEMTKVAQETDAKIKEAEQRLLAAQKSQSATDLEAARKELQQLEAEQLQRLKAIITKTQSQIDAFQSLKTQ